ncbi:hypothetical protein FHS19_003364 [Paenibacillus rhizosphaerae]|uniref:Uncharacterized protein n=1 Tax=Paenibacillus rhizosphaerae TaxID=297318 RepID=A0A839TST1_9BACL|nr:WG repeat-containing protein [Paenibacillus rhizosphaerae]MBB3128710.1 hypothetical protein [Paenibacillus rhizosphaerae]
MKLTENTVSSTAKAKEIIEAVYDGYGYSGVSRGAVYVEDHAVKKQYYFSSAGSELFEYMLRGASVLFNDRALYTTQVQDADGGTATRYGYIDSHGKVSIQPIYAQASNFSEGLARVNKILSFIKSDQDYSAFKKL